MSVQSDPWESVALEASRRKVRELSDSLGAAQVEISNRGERLASTRAVLSDTKDRLREEIANAEQAEERLASANAYSANVIEANRELAQRVMVLEGFLVLCEGHFRAQGQTSWAEEAARVLRPEVKA